MNWIPGLVRRFRFVPLAALILTSSAPCGPLAAQLTPIGLSEVRAQWFETPDFPFNPAEDEYFAQTLAIGDFNGDGAGDLVSGMPRDNGNGNFCNQCGAAELRFGRPGQALPATGPGTLLSPEHPGVVDPASAFEWYGAALAVGDFNGDDRDDLAVGIPYNAQAAGSTGAVAVHYGLAASAGGIQPAAEHFLRQGANGLPGEADDGQHFGDALAAGDFDNDGYDDLAIGAPWDDDCGADRCGTVTVLYGGLGGLMPFRGHFLHQGSDFIADEPEMSDLFGMALAAGDFDGNGADDLAIGVPGEDAAIGAVQVVFGSEWGLLFVANGIWRETELGDLSEPADYMGRSLAVGNFDGDSHDDLAIGVPYEDLGEGGSAEDAGLVILLYGGPQWFDISRTQLWTQDNIAQAPGYDQTNDRFGKAIAAGDFDGDGMDDLAVGHPGEWLGGSPHGAVTVLMGAPGGALGQRHRTLFHGVDGLPGAGGALGGTGDSLAAGDLDADGFADLALGLPNWYDGESTQGAEIVLYGALFADGFELGATGRWSATQR